MADVFLTAWRRLDELPDGDAARIWLYATARRVMANQRRSRRRGLALRERLQHHAPSVADEDPPAREEALVHEALRRLARRDREVLLLSEWEGLAPAEIAAVLGCLTVTARGRLHRARRRFRAAFEELLVGDETEPPRHDALVSPTTSGLLRPAAVEPHGATQARKGGS